LGTQNFEGISHHRSYLETFSSDESLVLTGLVFILLNREDYISGDLIGLDLYRCGLIGDGEKTAKFSFVTNESIIVQVGPGGDQVVTDNEGQYSILEVACGLSCVLSDLQYFQTTGSLIVSTVSRSVA
jgi:hypothetical protein